MHKRSRCRLRDSLPPGSRDSEVLELHFGAAEFAVLVDALVLTVVASGGHRLVVGLEVGEADFHLLTFRSLKRRANGIQRGVIIVFP